MKPDLGDVFPPTWAGAPPHMSPQDLPIWNRYRDKHMMEWSAVYYDTALGVGGTLPDGEDAAAAAMWQRITRKRADAIIYTGREWIIVEVRANAGPGALGSILTYLALWRADPPDHLPVRGIVLTDRMDADTAHAAAATGIPVEIA